MPTLMRWGNSEGEKGRCDAKCHNAQHPECDCMCGGRYHGAGLVEGELERRVEKDWEGVLERAQARAKAEGMHLDVFGFQGDLFGGDK
jgi:hypothetical protein